MAARPRRSSTAEIQSAVTFDRNDLETGFLCLSRGIHYMYILFILFKIVINHLKGYNNFVFAIIC